MPTLPATIAGWLITDNDLGSVAQAWVRATFRRPKLDSGFNFMIFGHNRNEARTQSASIVAPALSGRNSMMIELQLEASDGRWAG